MTAFAVHDYDERDDEHRGFLWGTFHDSLFKGPPWCYARRGPTSEAFRRQLSLPGVRILVATLHDKPDDFLGWLAALPRWNDVIYAFTKYDYRQKFGVMSTLAEVAGVDFTRPCGVRFWTRASERIRAREGYGGLYFRVTDPDEDERRAQRPTRWGDTP